MNANNRHTVTLAVPDVGALKTMRYETRAIENAIMKPSNYNRQIYARNVVGLEKYNAITPVGALVLTAINRQQINPQNARNISRYSAPNVMPSRIRYQNGARILAMTGDSDKTTC